MKPLDEKTLNVLADIICADGKLHYRSGRELASFFRAAGWSDISVYDGESRRAWTLDHLIGRRDEPTAIEQVILRLVDRREYPGHPDVVDKVRFDLNRLLEPEILHIEIDSELQPHIKTGRANRVDRDDDPSRQRLLYSIEEIVTDKRLVPLLKQRVGEFEACRKSGSHLAAVILAGSLLEGVLLDAAETRPIPEGLFEEQDWKDQKARRPSGSKWDLHALVYVACRLHWIDSDVAEVIGALRKFRNLVHPRLQRELVGEVPDEDTLSMYWPIVVGTINDLAKTKPGRVTTNSQTPGGTANPWKSGRVQERPQAARREG